MEKKYHNSPDQTKNRTHIHEAIAARAYKLWEERGRPEGQADEIWLEAERSLITGRKKSQADLSLPVSF